MHWFVLHNMRHGCLRYLRGKSCTGQRGCRIHSALSSGRVEAFQGRNCRSRIKTEPHQSSAENGVSSQVDAIVSSVNRMGVFADVGPLPVFVSSHVRSDPRAREFPAELYIVDSQRHQMGPKRHPSPIHR